MPTHHIQYDWFGGLVCCGIGVCSKTRPNHSGGAVETFVFGVFSESNKDYCQRGYHRYVHA